MTGTSPSGWPVEGRPVIRRAAGADGRGGRGSASPLRADPLHGVEEERGAWRPEARDLVALGLWVGALLAAVGGLHLLGRTAMASPAVTQPGDWLAWAGTATTDALAFNVLRILGLALAWYLLGVTTIGMLARLLAMTRLVRVADLLTVGPVRTLLQQALGATLAASAVASLPGTALAAAPPRVEVTAPAVPGARGLEVAPASLDIPERVVPESDLVARAPSPDSWQRLLDLGAAPIATNLDEVVTPVREPDQPSAAAGAGGTHTVAPGEHFWSIAQETVGREANDEVVASYWESLVEANRSRLVDPANPDLLLVGQVVVLPAPS